MPKKAPPRKDHNKVPRAPRELAPAAPREAERVAKVVARAGLGSRREIEEWILAGRVSVNGEVLDTPARTVTPEDRIEVDGVPLPARERTRLFLYHKPKGVVTTNFDPEGRPTLFEILPAALPRLVSVGRLDLNTEGLILLTNDGGLSRVLELPETGWLRRYRVRAKGEITQDKLDALIRGVTVDGVHYGPIEAMLDRVQGANVWLTLALREGKNREVRNVLGSLGLDVNRLIRLSYGPFQLGEIAQGGIEEVRTRVLADQLGPELTAAAGADFDGPVFTYDETDDESAPRGAKAGTKASAASGAKGAPRYAKAEGAEDRHRRLPISTEPSAERTVKAGLVSDRKGRKVLVQRVRSTAETDEVQAPARRPSRTGERDAHRVPGGERTFRKRPDGERGEGDRPSRSRPPRAEGERSERSFRPRPEGDRPFRERAPRRERPEGEGTERPFRSRPPRAEGERSERPFRPRPEGDRPFRERAPRRERPEGESAERPFRSRPPRAEGERSERPFRPRPEGDRPFRERAPRRERPEGEGAERPFRSRPPRAEGERSERPFRPRPEGDRPFRERAPRRERPEGERHYRGEGTDRPYTGRVKSEERSRERPEGGRSGKSFEGKSFGGKPFGGKPGGRPSGGKPGGKPGGGRPGGRPSGGGRPPRG